MTSDYFIGVDKSVCLSCLSLLFPPSWRLNKQAVVSESHSATQTKRPNESYFSS